MIYYTNRQALYSLNPETGEVSYMGELVVTEAQSAPVNEPRWDVQCSGGRIVVEDLRKNRPFTAARAYVFDVNDLNDEFGVRLPTWAFDLISALLETATGVKITRPT